MTDEEKKALSEVLAWWRSLDASERAWAALELSELAWAALEHANRQ